MAEVHTDVVAGKLARLQAHEAARAAHLAEAQAAASAQDSNRQNGSPVVTAGGGLNGGKR